MVAGRRRRQQSSTVWTRYPTTVGYRRLSPAAKLDRMTASDLATQSGPGRDEWDRLRLAWHGAFGVLVTTTALLVITQDEPSPQQRWTAVAALTGLALWYLVVGGRAIHRDDERLGRTYLVLAIPLTLIPFALSPFAAIMLFMLYPHIWMLLPQRQATMVTAVAVLATGGVMTLATGFGSTSIVGMAAFCAAALMFTAALGLWITRIVEQSQRRAELVNQLNAAQTELAEAGKRAGVAEERERLAREIHDTLAQGFAAVAMLIDAAKSDIGHDDDQAKHLLTRAGDIARENLDEARTLVHALTPPTLREGSLSDVLRRVVKRLDDESSISFEFTSAGPPRPLPPAQEIAVLRVTQEATGNARAHAHAATVSVFIDFGADETRLKITDDGCGFDTGFATGGYGLSGMRGRVTETGGSLTVDSAQGRGTTVIARWPNDH